VICIQEVRMAAHASSPDAKRGDDTPRDRGTMGSRTSGDRADKEHVRCIAARQHRHRRKAARLMFLSALFHSDRSVPPRAAAQRICCFLVVGGLEVRRHLHAHQEGHQRSWYETAVAGRNKHAPFAIFIRISA
jgi:hypothetical protein